jgi:tetratricopeptide (TPR) repeat protein
LINPDQPTLHKNLGAIEASRGNYVIAQSSLQQALHSNPSDAVNHRNFAKVREALGDTRTALKHNLASIALEAKFNKYPSDTTSHRLAAVQNITLGGDLKYSLELMTAARQKEGKEFDSFEFVSRRRTEELIQQISHRKGSPMEVLEKMLAEQQDRRSLEEAVRKGDVSAILKHRGMGGQAKKH